MSVRAPALVALALGSLLVGAVLARAQDAGVDPHFRRPAGRLIGASDADVALARRLAGEGCTVDEDQVYRLELPLSALDGALLVPVICESEGPRHRAHVRVVQGERVVQSLDDHASSAWYASEIQRVGLRDVNHDGFSDLLVIVSAMSGMGPDGAIPFPVPDFWLGGAERFGIDAEARAQLAALRRIPRTMGDLEHALRHFFHRRAR
jgi:hypothetical protein